MSFKATPVFVVVTPKKEGSVPFIHTTSFHEGDAIALFLESSNPKWYQTWDEALAAGYTIANARLCYAASAPARKGRKKTK